MTNIPWTWSWNHFSDTAIWCPHHNNMIGPGWLTEDSMDSLWPSFYNQFLPVSETVCCLSWHHFFRQTIPVHDHSVRKELHPLLVFSSLCLQFQLVFPGLIATGSLKEVVRIQLCLPCQYLVGLNELSSQYLLLKAAQPQFLESFLIWDVPQALHHLRCPPLHPFQHFEVLYHVRTHCLNAVLSVHCAVSQTDMCQDSNHIFLWFQILTKIRRMHNLFLL